MRLDGLHHITAITGDAPQNVDFYAGVLGLRMVAKTVNQDDPNVYHLFYADENGSPGSDITFFEYPGAAPGPGRPRDGAPRHLARGRRRGARLLGRADGRGALGRTPWSSPTRRASSTSCASRPRATHPFSARHSEIPPEHALLGFEGVRARSLRPGRVRDAAGGPARRRAPWRRHLGDPRRRARLDDHVRAGRPSAACRVPARSTTSRGTRQRGPPKWLEKIEGAGVRTSAWSTGRYFHSIYFREPGGIL